MKRALLIIALLAVIALAITARPIDTGYAWDFGGIDSDGVFLCPASGHMESGQWIIDWQNPLAPFFPSLVTDC